MGRNAMLSLGRNHGMHERKTGRRNAHTQCEQIFHAIQPASAKYVVSIKFWAHQALAYAITLKGGKAVHLHGAVSFPQKCQAY